MSKSKKVLKKLAILAALAATTEVGFSINLVSANPKSSSVLYENANANEQFNFNLGNKMKSSDVNSNSFKSSNSNSDVSPSLSNSNSVVPPSSLNSNSVVSPSSLNSNSDVSFSSSNSNSDASFSSSTASSQSEESVKIGGYTVSVVEPGSEVANRISALSSYEQCKENATWEKRFDSSDGHELSPSPTNDSGRAVAVVDEIYDLLAKRSLFTRKLQFKGPQESTSEEEADALPIKEIIFDVIKNLKLDGQPLLFMSNYDINETKLRGSKLYEKIAIAIIKSFDTGTRGHDKVWHYIVNDMRKGFYTTLSENKMGRYTDWVKRETSGSKSDFKNMVRRRNKHLNSILKNAAKHLGLVKKDFVKELQDDKWFEMFKKNPGFFSAFRAPSFLIRWELLFKSHPEILAQIYTKYGIKSGADWQNVNRKVIDDLANREWSAQVFVNSVIDHLKEVKKEDENAFDKLVEKYGSRVKKLIKIEEEMSRKADPWQYEKLMQALRIYVQESNVRLLYTNAMTLFDEEYEKDLEKIWKLSPRSKGSVKRFKPKMFIGGLADAAVKVKNSLDKK